MARPKGTKIFQKRINISITDKLAAEIDEFARENDLSESEAMRTLMKRGLNWAKKARDAKPSNDPSNVSQDDYKSKSKELAKFLCDNDIDEEEMKEIQKIARIKWVANP